MAFFALLWKARTIEKYRQNYEKEKINSIVLGHTQMEQTLSQRWRHYRYDTQKRISRTFKRWYPEGSGVANFFLYLMTDQTFPNFLLKSMMGFVGGIVLTYLCFMFFVFQLSISLIHATIMSSIIGILLTLGLAFSYRIRCLVFLLIPQFFSRVGRYTLTCYALVLILTGPATNTLKNSEVLSESMACSQEQIKTSVHQLNDLMKKPYNSMKDSIKLMIDRLKAITMKVKETVVKLDRLVLSIVSVIQSSFSWVQSVADICNAKLGTPYDRCNYVLEDGISDCKKTLGPDISTLCNVAYIAQSACYSVKPFKAFCYVTDFMDEAILASVKKKLRNFTEHLRAMFHVEVHIHHSYSYSSNTSRSASQVTAGIVTEIRNRADPLLTWLSWSSCVTSLFLLLIIFRAKYYQHMYETRSRFDNRYVTKELQEFDLKRQRQGRETILPLNRRERAKYITTTSFRLVASEKVYLNRSAVFMAITTFKLLIHMVADYSLYWVLMTIRYHGGYQSDLMPGIPHSGVHVSGSGFVARLFRSIVGTLDIPLTAPSPSPISCLPNPYPPDFRRYTQIGVLIFLLWFFALFEPYGLRLRHLIMGLYRPERAKARATWLYNHILRTRAGFMKFARRKLHREYKYSSEASLTFRKWVEDHIPFQCLKSLLGIGPKEPHCLLCGITSCSSDPDSQLSRCQTPNCPGIYCSSCFADIGQLCTICLTPADYGDLSDVSLEKGSSDDSDSEGGLHELNRTNEYARLLQNNGSNHSTGSKKESHPRWGFFTKAEPIQPPNTLALLASNLHTYIDDKDFSNSSFQNRFRKIKRNMQIRNWDKKYTRDWVAKLSPEYMYEDIANEENYDFYSDILEIEQNGDFEEIFSKTKSIGINTDKNRGIILNAVINRFTRRKVKQLHTNKQKKPNWGFTSDKEVYHFENGVISEEHSDFKTKRQILSVVEPKKRSLVLTKKFHCHKKAIRQRNVIKVVRSKKKQKTKYEIKIFKAVKGVMKTIRCIMNNNDQIRVTNQNKNTAPNKLPIKNNGEITKPSNNPNHEGKRNKKKSPNSNKPKRLGKQKGVIRIKTKNSRHRLAEFHTFFSKHWNYIKYSIIPCTSTQTRSDAPMPKEKRNHKRRKKRKAVDFSETEMEHCIAKKDIKHTRNLRISAFLAELEWTKRDFKKDKNYEANDSYLCTDRVHAPITTNKIVGMVQLKNLPFQWREAPRYEFCNCRDKRCSCGKGRADKPITLFAPESKQKIYAKKALERFRNKINTTVDTPSSLLHKMMSTMNVVRERSPINQDSSICIAKRTSFYREFTQDLNQDSDAVDTDMLFKNENFLDEFVPDLNDLNRVSTSKYSTSNTFLGQEMIISHSSSDSKKPRITRRCRCDVYEDIQRRWTHVKKTLSDKGFRNPLNIMKNFCSSLFGPSCTIETCPNQKEKQEKMKQEKMKQEKMKQEKMKQDKSKTKTKKKSSKEKSNSKKKGNTATQTATKKQTKKSQMASQTQCVKDTETQLTSETELCQSIQALAKKNEDDKCEKEREQLKECEEKERKKEDLLGQNFSNSKVSLHIIDKIDTGTDADDEATRQGINMNEKSNKKVREGIHLVNKGVHVEPDMASGACQAVECPNYCHRSMQYEDGVVKDNVGKPVAGTKSKDMGSVKCFCDETAQVVASVQIVRDMEVGTVNEVCTCATQHHAVTNRVNVGTRLSRIVVGSATFNQRSHVANKKTQRSSKQVTQKGNHYVTRKTYGKKGKDAKSGRSRRRRKLSLESSLCVFEKVDRSATVSQAIQDMLTDTVTDTSMSSLSLRSDETKTDTTICSLATIDYDDTPRRRKFRVKVITKTNQATLTDKTRVCDTGTITNDWWSPIIERKANDKILLEKKKGYNTIERQKKELRELKELKELRELKELKELREVRKRRRNCGVTTDGRIVTFRSRTQIIPTGLLPTTNDVMSPSRYLLESQKYYNELFAYNFRPPPQVEYTCVSQVPKYQEREKIRSPRSSRRNHHYKTKRLDECYSPRRQVSPRKRYTESTNTRITDYPCRRSYTHHHTKNR